MSIARMMQMARAGVSVGKTDPYFSDVSLLLHGDGSSGSTSIIDNSSNNFTLNVYGDASISTAEKKFGTGSIQFDGSGDVLTVSSSAEFRLDADFTIEAWVYPTSQVRLYPAILNVGARYSAGPRIGVYFNHTANPNEYVIYINTTLFLTGAIAPGFNTWHHVALTRSGDTWRLFVNGVLDVSNTRTGTVFTSDPPFTVASESATRGITDFTGYIDDMRVTKGVARYTASFTPPTTSFPDS